MNKIKTKKGYSSLLISTAALLAADSV